MSSVISSIWTESSATTASSASMSRTFPPFRVVGNLIYILDEQCSLAKSLRRAHHAYPSARYLPDDLLDECCSAYHEDSRALRRPRTTCSRASRPHTSARSHLARGLRRMPFRCIPRIHSHCFPRIHPYPNDTGKTAASACQSPAIFKIGLLCARLWQDSRPC